MSRAETSDCWSIHNILIYSRQDKVDDFHHNKDNFVYLLQDLEQDL